MPIYNDADAESYETPEEDAGYDWANAPDQLSNEDADIARYIDEAAGSGVETPLLQTLKDAWKTGGKVVDKASSWIKDNKELTSMFTSGVANAQKNKLTQEQLEQKRKWDLEDRATKKADEAELWERRNQSVIGTKPAQLGILGSNMLNSHVDYLKNRK